MHHPLLTDQLCDALGRMLIMEETKLDVRLDGELALRMEYDATAGQLVCSIPLDRRKSAAEEDLLRDLLSANAWIGGAGATLCLTRAAGTSLRLHTSTIAGLNDPRFEQLAEDLLAMSERWQDYRRARAQEPSPPQGDCASGRDSAADFSPRRRYG